MKSSLFIAFLLAALTGFAQKKDTTSAPYKRFPDLPPIQILLGDSVHLFDKSDVPLGRPIVYMVFSPECSHCQHETEELVKHKDELKDVQFIMITMQPLWEMNNFIKDYHVNELAHVVVGRDTHYTAVSFYDIRSLPFVVTYTAKGKLIESFEGSASVEKILESVKKKD